MAKEISKSKLKNRDILEVIRFAYFADEVSFKKAFAEKGIGIDDETDLLLLADYAKSGKDKSGELKKEDGTPIVFNAMDIIHSYDIDLNKLDNSGIKFIE